MNSEDTGVLSDALRARHQLLHRMSFVLAIAAAAIAVAAAFWGVTKVSSAVGLVLASLSLLLQWRAPTALQQRAAVAAAAAAAAVGVFIFVQHLTGAAAHGRAALDVGASLTCLGFALGLLGYPRVRPASHAFAAIAGVFPYFALLGYLFSASVEDGTSAHTSMPAITALCFGLLSVGTLLARTDGPVIRELVNFNRYIAATWVVLLALLLATGWSWWSARLERARGAEAAFEYETLALRMRLFARFARNEVLLTSGRALFNSSTEVSREEWSRFVATMNIGEFLPGMLGLGYAARVHPAERASHVASVAREFPDYRIWPPDDGASREQYGPIVFLEPFPERNLRAIGYDMLSEPVRREAMMRAMDSGHSAMSAAVRLVQEHDADRDF